MGEILHAVAGGQVSVHELETGEVAHAARHVHPEHDQVAHGRLVAVVPDVAQQVAVAHVRKDNSWQQVLVEADADQRQDVFVAELAHAQSLLHEETHLGRQLRVQQSSF